MIYLRCFHRPTLDRPGGGIQRPRVIRSAYLSFFALRCLPDSLTMAFLLDICCLVFLTVFVRALPTILPSINFSNSTFSLGPTEVAFFATSSGSYSGSHAQTKYGGPLTSSPPWIDGPPKGPGSPPPEHHRPYVPPTPCSSSVSTQASSLAVFGPGTILSSISGQPPSSSYSRATSGSYGNSGSAFILRNGAGSLFSSVDNQAPYPVNGLAKSSFALSSRSALGSPGNSASFSPSLRSIPSSATVATSPLTLSSASTTLGPAATDTNDCGIIQSFYGQTAENLDAIDKVTWLNI